MSDLSTSTCGGRRPQDPRKRVNYTTGLVLGEDEFVQDQTHLRERDHLGVRGLHGYGTVAGLGVRWDEAQGQLRVAPGLAVDPAGRFVCVPTEQCADLGAWLSQHRDAIVEAAEGEESEEADGELPEGELPEQLTLYVVLCYRECETDTVPVPSESCRSADESMAASRILESFELRLRLAPPGRAGEVAGDALPGAIERLLEIAAERGEDGDIDTDAVRRELTTWATTDRPELADRPCLAAPEDDCGERTDEPSTAVLLARVQLGLTDAGEGRVVPDEPEVDDAERPVLLSTRFLQEWLLGLVGHPELFAAGDHSILENLEADDHPQYLPVDGSRPLTGTLDAGLNVIRRLRQSNGPSHAMRRDEIVGYDLAPAADGLHIVSLQGERVVASRDHAPRAGDVLRYDGERWVPAAIPDRVPESPVRSGLPLVTIERLGRGEAGATFLLWFTFEAPGAEVALAVEDDESFTYGSHLRILSETCGDGRPSVRQVGTNQVRVRHVGCNVVRVDVMREQAEFLRFVFETRLMMLDTGVSVAEFAEERRIAWVGEGADGTVTTFVVNPTRRTPYEGFEDVEVLVAPAGGADVSLERR